MLHYRYWDVSEPFKLRGDLDGGQQNTSVIYGTFAKLRNKVTTNGKVRLSPVIAIISHSTLTLVAAAYRNCLLYTSPSPRDLSTSRMPSSA